MGTDFKVRPHHKKFFDDLRAKCEAEEKALAAPRILFKEQAQIALKATNGNITTAARLLGWSRNKLRYHLESLPQ